MQETWAINVVDVESGVRHPLETGFRGSMAKELSRRVKEDWTVRIIIALQRICCCLCIHPVHHGIFGLGSALWLGIHFCLSP